MTSGCKIWGRSFQIKNVSQLIKFLKAIWDLYRRNVEEIPGFVIPDV